MSVVQACTYSTEIIAWCHVEVSDNCKNGICCCFSVEFILGNNNINLGMASKPSEVGFGPFLDNLVNKVDDAPYTYLFIFYLR